MRAFIILTLLGCTVSTPALSLEQSCAEGQTAVEGSWDITPSLDSLSERLDERFVAALARRTTAPLLAPTQLFPDPEFADEEFFITCMLRANHEIVDGMGWLDAGTIEVQGRTPQGHWVTSDGTPVSLPDVRVSEHFFDPRYESMAPDDELYVLFLIPMPDGSYLLRRRAELMDDIVSGEHTESGEDAPLELFRR